ncbi:MAG: hypothetical protein IJG51_05720 [Synergistaceae bacterium]|nr:hypothetical protein [Synergistaceae bacterium]MBQ3759188.1 hypothetical protein [Synergistaceae bacterium]MBQ6980970.1 hypothetical protein [Synergistaceae bacterium]
MHSSEAEYDAPTLPSGRLVVVMLRSSAGGWVTASVNVFLSDPALFLAVAVTL